MTEIICANCNKKLPNKRFIIFTSNKKKILDVCRQCRYNRKTIIQFHIFRNKNKLC